MTIEKLFKNTDKIEVIDKSSLSMNENKILNCIMKDDIQNLEHIFSNLEPTNSYWMTRGRYLFRFFKSNKIIGEIQYIYPKYLRWENVWESDMLILCQDSLMEWFELFDVTPCEPSFSIYDLFKEGIITKEQLNAYINR